MEKTSEYNYVAKDARGNKRKGVVSAISNDKAYQALITQGLTPTKVVKKSDGLMQKEIVIPGFEPKAKLKPLALFAKQFALLVRSGMPMLESLSISAEQTTDKTLKKALLAVIEDVERGMTLAKAMKKQEAAFPGLLTAIVAVGEEGGFLDKSLESMAKTYKTELQLRQKLKSAMTYPVIVIIASAAILAGMLIFVVPIFEEMFHSMHADLPPMTQALIAISNNMLWITPLTAVVIFMLIFLYRKYISEDWLLSKVDKIKLKAPVFGALNNKVIISRFSRNLAMMLSAGVALIPALKLVSTTANNWHVTRAINEAIYSMENGKSLSTSVESFDMFPPMVTNMIIVGERSGNLSLMLDTVADFYDDEVKEASDSLSDSLEPILLLVLGGVVGSMLFALYIPMLQMMSMISEG